MLCTADYYKFKDKHWDQAVSVSNARAPTTGQLLHSSGPGLGFIADAYETVYFATASIAAWLKVSTTVRS